MDFEGNVKGETDLYHTHKRLIKDSWESVQPCFRVTGPVMSKQSAGRGEATKWGPNRSMTKYGFASALISSSQPLRLW